MPLRLLVLFSTVFFLTVSFAAARGQDAPLLLVSERGGFSQIAPQQHRLAIYPDGTVYRRNVRGKIDSRLAEKIASQVFREATDSSTSSCTKGLPTATITATTDGRSRSVSHYGLGSCSRRGSLARLVLFAEDLPLKDIEAVSGPWVAYATLADGFPGRSAVLKGRRLLPGEWRRVSRPVPQVVRSGGHRYLLTPRLILPHELGNRAPGVTVAELRRRARTGPRSLLGAPVMKITSDRRWVGQDESGRWKTGTLGEDELSRALDGLKRSGYFALKKNYSLRQLRFYRRTTLKVFGDSRRTVRVAGLERGVGIGGYPLDLARSTAILMALQPDGTEEYRPTAIRVRWARTSNRSVVTMGKMPFRVKRRSGQTLLVGQKAAAVWDRYGRKSDAGVAHIAGRRYRLAIEPAL